MKRLNEETTWQSLPLVLKAYGVPDSDASFYWREIRRLYFEKELAKVVELRPRVLSLVFTDGKSTPLYV